MVENQLHYICPECGGFSSIPKACDTQGCHLYGRMMEACTCTDGKHVMALNDNI